METAVAPQTLDQIGLASVQADGTLDNLERDLEQARGAFWRRSAMNYDPGSDAGRALVDVELPALIESEQATLAELDALGQTLGEHVKQLQSLGFRADLKPDEHQAMLASVPMIREELTGLSAAELTRSIKTALAYGDRARIAGFATLGPALVAQRADIRTSERWEVESVLASCRKATGDRRGLQVEERIERVQTRLRNTRSELIQRVHRHVPGSIGSRGERHTFGVPAPDRYRQDLLEIRAGLADLD